MAGDVLGSAEGRQECPQRVVTDGAAVERNKRLPRSEPFDVGRSDTDQALEEHVRRSGVTSHGRPDRALRHRS